MAKAKPSLRKFWYIPVIVVVVVAAVIGGVLWFKRGSTGNGNTAYQAYTVTRGNLTATVSVTGEVYAPRSVSLSFDVSKLQLTELNVVAGQKVKAGDVIARIETTSLERAVKQAQANLTTSQDNLAKVKEPYTALDLIQARLTVSQSLVSLADAQDNLDTVTNPDTDTAAQAVRDASANLESAKSSLTLAQDDNNNTVKIANLQYEAKWYEDNYYAAQVKFNKGEITQLKLDYEYSNMIAAQQKLATAKVQAAANLTSAQNQVTKAQSTLYTAIDNLDKLQQGPTEVDLERAKNQVALAEYNLAKARDNLATIEAGPTEQQIAVAQASVDNAQAALETAQAALLAATMVAPFDGTIVSVGAKVDDLVSSGTPIVTLADLTDLRVRATVGETDIANMSIGQEAQITFDAIAGAVFTGTIQEIPLQGSLTNNVLTYAVPVSLEGESKEALKAGMTANIKIVVGKQTNVLLIPSIVVQQGTNGKVVLVQDKAGQTPYETPVVLGLSDGTYVVVKQGLNEGDQVVIDYSLATATTSSNRAGGTFTTGGGVQIIQGGPPGGGF
jgi:HlyD family secretion protein